MKTIDLERLAERGTEVERFWAVVLLLAVKDGATRVWYDPAQGESRLGYEVGGMNHAMVPPPESLQSLILRVVEKLLRSRSPWSLIASVFRGSAHRDPQEGAFMARVGVDGVIVAVTLNRTESRVVLRLVPEARAVPVARAALDRATRNYRSA